MTESAMVLTQDEWDSLAGACKHFLLATEWADREASLGGIPERPVRNVLDRRALCRRIVEAA